MQVKLLMVAVFLSAAYSAQAQNLQFSRNSGQHGSRFYLRTQVKNGAPQDDTEQDVSDEELISIGSDADDAETARGGGGGGGGDADGGGNGADGDDGQDGPTVDGDDGTGTNGTPGKGGGKGANGIASAEVLADGITEFAPDLQPLVGWSFTHAHSLVLELKGGGGGGGGGGGTNMMGDIVTAGGNGGRGEDAQGAGLSGQASQIDVASTLGQYGSNPFPPNTDFDATCYATVGWGSSGLGNGMAGPTWLRGCNVAMVCGSVTLQLTGRNANTLDAIGSDDNGMFMRSSSSLLTSEIGELVIDAWELVGTANLGDVATINGIASARIDQFGNPVNSGAIGVPGEVYQWDGMNLVQADLPTTIATSPIYSLVTANETPTGGAGGGGSPTGNAGLDGAPTQSNSPAGGLGGADGTMTFPGGTGGVGGSIDLQELGQFEGSFNIEVEP
jgi:hypothetical protein